MMANCAGIIGLTVTGFIVQSMGAFTSAFVLAGVIAIMGVLAGLLGPLLGKVKLKAQGVSELVYEPVEPVRNEVIRRPYRLLIGPVDKVTSAHPHDRLPEEMEQHRGVEIAPIAAFPGEPQPAQAQPAARGGSGGGGEGDGSAQSGNGDPGAQHGLPGHDGEIDLQIGAVHREIGMARVTHAEVHVAGGAAPVAGGALSGQPDALAFADARRNPHLIGVGPLVPGGLVHPADHFIAVPTTRHVGPDLIHHRR